MFFECSAKTGFNVQEIFQCIAQIIIKDKLPQTVTNNGVGGAGAGNGRANQGPQILSMKNQEKKEDGNGKGGCC